MPVSQDLLKRFGGMYFFYDQHERPEVIGGKKRAATAERDAQGRFLPAPTLQEFWALDPDHGKAGGRRRQETGKKDKKGRFLPDRKEPQQ